MIDSHTHLTDESFSFDREEVIARCFKSGVNFFLEVLTSPKDWEKFKIFEKYENFYFAFGIHPNDTSICFQKTVEKIDRYLNLKKTVAIGETGIDLWYHPQSFKDQLKLTEIMMDKALKFSKPCIFHIRNSKTNNSAYKIVLEFLKQRRNMINKQGIIHSFSGEVEEAKSLIDLGFYIGVNATITYPRNEKLRKVVKKIPLETILTETDSPYLPPQRIRGKRNEPSSVEDVIAAISDIKAVQSEKVSEIIEKNFLRFLSQSL
ncbi:MAG: TatD family hydrolase [Elusimicrobiales bacterium]